MSALIILHLQNDYLEGGSIGIKDSLQLINRINKIKERDQFKLHIYINDLHPADHISFKKKNGTFPSHCVRDSNGCQLNDCIKINKNDIIINIGTLTMHDSTSAFYNAKDIHKMSNLDQILSENGINEIYLSGLTAEDDIFSTALDALKLKYRVTVLKDIVKGYDNETTEKCFNYLSSLGINIINS